MTNASVASTSGASSSGADSYALLPTITDPKPGGTVVEGTSPAHGWKMLLRVEIRRNEVWLSARPVTGLVDEDIAVGLDDFQEALDEAIGGDSAP